MPRYVRTGPVRQARRENGSGRRSMLKAMVSPETNESVRVSALARGVSISTLVAEAIERSFGFGDPQKDTDNGDN